MIDEILLSLVPNFKGITEKQVAHTKSNLFSYQERIDRLLSIKSKEEVLNGLKEDVRILNNAIQETNTALPTPSEYSKIYWDENVAKRFDLYVEDVFSHTSLKLLIESNIKTMLTNDNVPPSIVARFLIMYCAVNDLSLVSADASPLLKMHFPYYKWSTIKRAIDNIRYKDNGNTVLTHKQLNAKVKAYGDYKTVIELLSAFGYDSVISKY